MGNQGVDGPPGPKVKYQEPIFFCYTFHIFFYNFQKTVFVQSY